MKKCIGKIKGLINDGNTEIKIRFNEEMFLEAVKCIADDIRKTVDIKNKKIGLIGIARGALPLLVALSHELEIRNISVVQLQMTNSNERWDYGNVKWVNGYIEEGCDEYIILEDMVSHARSVNYLVNELVKQNKKIAAIYTLFMNNDMFDINLDNEYMDIKYVNLSCQQQWIYFFWERGYRI